MLLIIPMEQTFTLKHLPWVTGLLIILNTLLYFGFAGGDERKIVSATDEYLRAIPLKDEYPYFSRYRISTGEVDTDLTREEIQRLNKPSKRFLAYAMLRNVQYGYYLKRTEMGLAEGQEKEGLNKILRARLKVIEGTLSGISVLNFGLSTANPTLSSFFTHQFMHGDFMHLLGNMAILLIIGLTVEQLLGSVNYLLFYLISGAVGGIAFLVFHFSPIDTYLVGASGSIAGVSGMYVMAYGARKIRFFFFIVVYFNYFRTTALLLLPLMVGKELWDYFYTDSNVAYMAHAGGLVAGALLVLLGKMIWLDVDTSKLENVDDSLEYRKKLNVTLQLLSSGSLDIAKQQFMALHHAYPDEPRVLWQLYHLHKLTPDSKDFHLVAMKYLQLSLQHSEFESTGISVLRDYMTRAKPHALFNGALLSRIVMKLVSMPQTDLAEQLFELRQDKMGAGDRQELIQAFAHHFRGSKPKKEAHYQAMLVEPGSQS